MGGGLVQLLDQLYDTGTPKKGGIIDPKNGPYDKMNEKGFIPVETQITNGDVIFGKITTPNTVTNSEKIFKDCSEQYMCRTVAIDMVYTGIKNQDGYEAGKALIRSKRLPHVGDMMCSKHHSKGVYKWKPVENDTVYLYPQEESPVLECDLIDKDNNAVICTMSEITCELEQVTDMKFELYGTI